MADGAEAILPEHRALVEQLARLRKDERGAVIAAAEEAAGTHRATIPWDELAAARGIVQLGGDAVEDGVRFHDEVSGLLKVEVEREADGRWMAEVPAFPGALAYGATREAATRAAMAVALRAAADRLEHGQPVPAALLGLFSASA